MPPSDPNNAPTTPASLAKAASRLFKKLVMDERTIEPDNRRYEERVAVAGEVTVLPLDAGDGAQPTRVFVRDLSKGGCGLWSRVGFASGTKLVVRFPGVSGGPPVQRIVEVCHCRGAASTGFAVGCRFVEAEAEAA